MSISEIDIEKSLRLLVRKRCAGRDGDRQMGGIGCASAEPRWH